MRRWPQLEENAPAGCVKGWILSSLVYINELLERCLVGSISELKSLNLVNSDGVSTLVVICGQERNHQPPEFRYRSSCNRYKLESYYVKYSGKSSRNDDLKTVCCRWAVPVGN